MTDRRRYLHTHHTHNNASILPTHVHENACLSRDRLCNSLATKKPHERKHTHGIRKALQSCSQQERRNKSHGSCKMLQLNVRFVCFSAVDLVRGHSRLATQCNMFALVHTGVRRYFVSRSRNSCQFRGGFREATIWLCLVPIRLWLLPWLPDPRQVHFRDCEATRPSAWIRVIAAAENSVAPDLLPSWDR